MQKLEIDLFIQQKRWDCYFFAGSTGVVTSKLLSYACKQIYAFIFWRWL